MCDDTARHPHPHQERRPTDSSPHARTASRFGTDKQVSGHDRADREASGTMAPATENSVKELLDSPFLARITDSRNPARAQLDKISNGFLLCGASRDGRT